MGEYQFVSYQIVEEHGKYGLASGQKVILKPIYASLVVVNEDKPLPEHILKEIEDDPYIDSVSELNSQIVIADGKHGLLECGKLVSGLKYERIIKLTFCDYLCIEPASWTLFHSFGGLTHLATDARPDELTLDGLLQILAERYAKACSHLSRNLYKDKLNGRYVSHYRRYAGGEFVDLHNHSYIHPFILCADRMIIHDDFQVTFLDTTIP